jgi:hypothetical protein
MVEEKQPTSQYLGESFCEEIRKMLREGLELEADDNLNETRWMKNIFAVIDKGLEDYNNDMGYTEDCDREPSASDEARYYGEDRG